MSRGLVGDCEVLVDGEDCGEPAVGKCDGCGDFVCAEHGILDEGVNCEACQGQTGLRPMRSL